MSKHTSKVFNPLEFYCVFIKTNLTDFEKRVPHLLLIGLTSGEFAAIPI